MDVRNRVMCLIFQFLEENGYRSTLDTLIAESGVDCKDLPSPELSGQLMRIVDQVVEKEAKIKGKGYTFTPNPEDGSFVNQELCTFSSLANGANILVSRFTSDVLISGCASGMLCVTHLSIPIENAVISKNSTDYLPIHKAGIVCIDVHPDDRNFILTGSMDKTVNLLDLRKSFVEPVQLFRDHKKYVVRVKFSPSGKFFLSASYDQSICIYRFQEGDWNLWKTIKFTGHVEAVDFKKNSDVFIVGVRDDHRLHIYDLGMENPLAKPRFLNMNAFGDDYVSFTAMDVSSSPDGEFILVSTDKERIILFHFQSGKQVMNYYGIVNDGYSQPRNCWHPSGNYFYSTSDDKSVAVFDIATASKVHQLLGHTGRVRDIHFSVAHGILVSSSFDGSVKLWHHKEEKCTEK